MRRPGVIAVALALALGACGGSRRDRRPSGDPDLGRTHVRTDLPARPKGGPDAAGPPPLLGSGSGFGSGTGSAN